jgi:aspartyl-tRNA(Asn)/glutamyl-tRNA(Gln) amidotransferase subunit A
MKDILDYNIASLQEEYYSGQTKVNEVAEQITHKVEKLDKQLNALLYFDKEKLVTRARELDKEIADGKRRLLTGVPIVIKDNLNWKGTPTTAASKMLKDYISPYTATVVKKLEDEGALIVGKANMDEFAMGSSGENSAYGVTRNPWNLECVPGGSSSGSAVSVAAGLSLASLGSDTGGSIRLPASMCGVVGLKPTYGRVSRYGVIALGSSLDQVGPMAKTVDDAANVFEVITGQDSKDGSSVDQIFNLDKINQIKIRGMKIGIVKEFLVGLEEKYKKVVQNAIKDLEKMGAELREISMQNFTDAIAVYYIIQSSECSANLARYDGIRYGGSTKNDEIIDIDQIRSADLGEEVKRRILLGTYSLSSGYYDDYFQKAAKVRSLIKLEAKKVFEEVDVLFGPTAPFCAFKIGDKINDPLQMYLSDIMTVGVSLAGLPSVSVPGEMVDKMPYGLQFIGNWFEEESIFAIARAYERINKWYEMKPQLDTN